MEDSEGRALAEEIKGYKDRKEYAECVKRMEEREKEVTDPVARAILLTAKATCASQMGDLALAESAAFAIDTEPLSGGMRNYVYLTQGSIASVTGQPERAELLFSAILASKEVHEEHQRDVLYEAFGRLGSLYADKNRFTAALDLLQKASILMPDGDSRDNFDLYLAYCLQALGRLDEAKECLKDVLENGSGEMKADTYYRLGAVQLQAGEYDLAMDSLHRALDSQPDRETLRSDILSALQEVKDEQNMDPADRPPSTRRPKLPAQ
jgi:tetratricopeptide (TPR) repeat protein